MISEKIHNIADQFAELAERYHRGEVRYIIDEFGARMMVEVLRDCAARIKTLETLTFAAMSNPRPDQEP